MSKYAKKSATSAEIELKLKQFNLSWSDVQEYGRLKAEIFGAGGPFRQLFVELDPKNNPDHKRYEELSKKMIHLHAHLINHRNG